jgi:hypothetical protein
MVPWWLGLASAAELHVPRDYTTLQAAVDAARPGDEVVVAGGYLFDGTVTIDRSILIQCAGASVQFAGMIVANGDANLTLENCTLLGAGPRPSVEHRGSGDVTIRDADLRTILIRVAGSLRLERVEWSNPSGRSFVESLISVGNGGGLYTRELRVEGFLTSRYVIEYAPVWPNPDVQVSVRDSKAKAIFFAGSSQATVFASGFVCNSVEDGLLVGPLIGGQFLAWGNRTNGRPLLSADYAALVNATLGHPDNTPLVAAKDGIMVNTAVVAPAGAVVRGLSSVEHVRTQRDVVFEGARVQQDVRVTPMEFWGTEVPSDCEVLTAMPKPGSPLRNAGRADILDTDGSPSDIGITGGVEPLFWSPDLDRDDVPAAFDCDDANPFRSPLLVEVAYNGIDDDCDGADLVDLDEDGDPSMSVGGGDCDDQNAERSSLIREVPYDGVDNDCSGSDMTDADGDGYDAVAVNGGTDCDDRDPDVHPGLLEDVSSIDRNCDGVRDPTTRLLPAGCVGSPTPGSYWAGFSGFIGMFVSMARWRRYN